MQVLSYLCWPASELILFRRKNRRHKNCYSLKFFVFSNKSHYSLCYVVIQFILFSSASGGMTYTINRCIHTWRMDLVGISNAVSSNFNGFFLTFNLEYCWFAVNVIVNIQFDMEEVLHAHMMNNRFQERKSQFANMKFDPLCVLFIWLFFSIALCFVILSSLCFSIEAVF